MKSCCVNGCTNRFKAKSQVSFYRLPKEEEKRSKWIAAIRRRDLNPGTESWICSSHFVSGKKSNDPRHPDYVPSLFGFTSNTRRTRAVRYKRYENISENTVNTITIIQLATPLLNPSEAEVQTAEVPEAAVPEAETVEVPGIEIKIETEETQTPTERQTEETQTQTEETQTQTEETQTEETHSDIASLHEQIKSLNTECQSLRNEVHTLQSDLKHLTLDPSQFDDQKMKRITGLPNLQTFMLLFSFASSVLPATLNHSLKPTQELLMTLMKLHLNLYEGFLGDLFGIHQSTVSRIVRRWIDVIGKHSSFSHLVAGKVRSKKHKLKHGATKSNTQSSSFLSPHKEASPSMCQRPGTDV